MTIKGKPVLIDDSELYRPKVDFPQGTHLYGTVLVALSEDDHDNHTVTTSYRFADQTGDKGRAFLWNRLQTLIQAALVVHSGSEGYDLTEGMHEVQY